MINSVGVTTLDVEEVRSAEMENRKAAEVRMRQQTAPPLTARSLMSRIHLSKADVADIEDQYVLDAIRSGWVAPLGPDVNAFEAENAARASVSHVLALSSRTAALHLGAARARRRTGHRGHRAPNMTSPPQPIRSFTPAPNRCSSTPALTATSTQSS
jgi:hypothetical protein